MNNGIVMTVNKIVILLFIFLFIQGCAHSDLSRSAAGDVDKDYIGIKSSINNIGKGDFAETYQNSSQTSKGILIGGLTGGIVGGIASSGVGVLGGVATGAILGGALGAYIDAHSTLVDKLKNRGVKIFVLGDQVLIVLPSSRIFTENTATISYTAYSTLDLVTELIGNYINMSVKVAGYTDSQGPPKVNLALSQQQADKVAKYLWRDKVNTRLLYSIGYGNTHLVSKSTCDWDSDNFRIEITLEKLPVC